jgi:tetratricopeptide (TPR) repeat protein
MSRRRSTALTALVTIVATVALSTARTEPAPVKDLHYGEVLFHFYNEDYFSAIVKSLAADESQRLARSEMESQVLLGGLYLSYGLHDEADRIFHAVLDDAADPSVRDRAWFFLAKIWYQRGYLDEALAALDRIQGDLPDEFEEERRMLGPQVLMRAGRYEEALAALEGWGEKSEWSAFARYNIGVALARSGRVDDAQTVLERVGEMRALTEEMLALRDKANLALGYMYLQQEQPAPAKIALQRVRLEGPFSNSALLGVGWADSADGDFERALVPWMELRHRSVAEPAVQESLLAIPYAMGQLDAGTQSARDYQYAIDAYTEEMGYIDLAMERVRNGFLIEDLLAANEDERRGWFWQLSSLPERKEIRYLHHMLANHEFQEALKNYRDLEFLAANLTDWSESIVAFEDMLATRREAYSTRLPRIEAALDDVDIDAIDAQRLALETEVRRITEERDVLGLVRGEEARQWQELEQAAHTLALLPESPEVLMLRDKQRVLAGHLYWQLNDQYPARSWEMRKSIRSLNRIVRQAMQRHHRVETARQAVPRQLDEFEGRIAAISPRIEALRGQLAMLLDAEREHVEMLAIRELDLQQNRLQTYLVQARFALAAIYDRYAEVSP